MKVVSYFYENKRKPFFCYQIFTRSKFYSLNCPLNIKNIIFFLFVLNTLCKSLTLLYQKLLLLQFTSRGTPKPLPVSHLSSQVISLMFVVTLPFCLFLRLSHGCFTIGFPAKMLYVLSSYFPNCTSRML